jgi:hypothetical protein
MADFLPYHLVYAGCMTVRKTPDICSNASRSGGILPAHPTAARTEALRQAI